MPSSRFGVERTPRRISDSTTFRPGRSSRCHEGTPRSITRIRRMTLVSLQDYRGSKVLITGGLGFIGSHLARRLVDLGADVTIVDSLIPEYGGNPYNIRKNVDPVHIHYSELPPPLSLR